MTLKPKVKSKHGFGESKHSFKKIIKTNLKGKKKNLNITQIHTYISGEMSQ